MRGAKTTTEGARGVAPLNVGSPWLCEGASGSTVQPLSTRWGRARPPISGPSTAPGRLMIKWISALGNVLFSGSTDVVRVESFTKDLQGL